MLHHNDHELITDNTYQDNTNSISLNLPQTMPPPSPPCLPQFSMKLTLSLVKPHHSYRQINENKTLLL